MMKTKENQTRRKRKKNYGQHRHTSSASENYREMIIIWMDVFAVVYIQTNPSIL